MLALPYARYKFFEGVSCARHEWVVRTTTRRGGSLVGGVDAGHGAGVLTGDAAGPLALALEQLRGARVVALALSLDGLPHHAAHVVTDDESSRGVLAHRAPPRSKRAKLSIRKC